MFDQNSPARGHSTSEFGLLLLGIGVRGFCLRLGLVSQIDFGDADDVDALAGAALGAVTAKENMKTYVVSCDIPPSHFPLFAMVKSKRRPVGEDCLSLF